MTGGSMRLLLRWMLRSLGADVHSRDAKTGLPQTDPWCACASRSHSNGTKTACAGNASRVVSHARVRVPLPCTIHLSHGKNKTALLTALQQLCINGEPLNRCSGTFCSRLRTH